MNPHPQSREQGDQGREREVVPQQISDIHDRVFILVVSVERKRGRSQQLWYTSRCKSAKKELVIRHADNSDGT